MFRRTIAFCLLLLASIGSAAQADIAINGYTDATNDRFTNSASFIASSFDLSGVGQTAGGRWATLVSSNVVISANHAAPTGNISFFANNDPLSVPVVRQVVSSMRIGNSDLWLGKLNAAVSPNITSYQFATQSLGTGGGMMESAGIYQNVNAYMMGLSPGQPTGNHDQAVGRNRISGFVGDVDINGQGTTSTDSVILWQDASNEADFVQYEARFNTFDSGAPLFVDSNGQLLLLGVNSFLTTNQSGTKFASGATYAGNYAPQIQQFIDANAVPEPSSMALLAVAGTATLWRLRRKPAHGKSEYSPN